MGKKWYKLQLILLVLGIIITYTAIGKETNATNHDQPTEQLSQITNTLQKYNIEVDGWQLYSRSLLSNNQTHENAKLEVMGIIKNNPSFRWDNHDSNIYTGKLEHTFMTETITVIITPHNQEYITYLIYQANGDSTVKDSLDFINAGVKNRHSHLFRKNTKIFTSVTGTIHDKLNFGLNMKAEEILNNFSATKVEELNEETFISFSAYTTLWDTYIETNQKKMNLQVALRNDGMGGKTTITIGTPIITTEY